MFTTNIKNIILDYIRLSPKSFYKLKKELFNSYVYLSVFSNKFISSKEILGIFTSYDKAYKYNIKDSILLTEQVETKKYIKIKLCIKMTDMIF